MIFLQNVTITLPLSFANLLDNNANSPVKTAGETWTQTSTETQTQIAVKRRTPTLEEIQIQPAEECQGQMVDESEIFVSGNTRISSTNETIEAKETQVVAETRIPSTEETRKSAVEAIETRATGVNKIRSAGKTQNQASTESTNLVGDKTPIKPREKTYTRTKTAEYKYPLPTEDAKNTEENESSILNGKDICYLLLPRDYQGKRVNPHIGPLPKVIPLKLFLDMVPSSSEDITRAMRGQLKPLETT